ncbi:MAG: HDIG domain-containing protein [Myxococcota bacterium]|nr:HDIG domain-containing protein [Myxococcota bacterium]
MTAKYKLQARRYGNVWTGLALAILFAGVGLWLSTAELWVSAWEIQPGAETPVTLRLPSHYFRITLLRAEFHYLSTSSSACPQMVPRGTKLQPGQECTGLALAYEKARRNKSTWRLAGLFCFYLVLGSALSIFMSNPKMGRARHLRSQATIFGLLVLEMLVAKGMYLFTSLPAVIVPVAFVGATTGYFYRRQVALTVASVAALVTVSLLNFDIQMFMVYVLSGTVAAAVHSKLRKRPAAQLKAGAMASWVALLAVLCTTVIFAGTWDVYDDAAEHLDPRHSIWVSALISGLASGVFAMLITPAVDKVVGEVSRVTLIDLQDLDQRLLKHLRERAPGTWEHSRAMANLAEAATHAISGNALLARVGAYYHDVGKSIEPEFFIENQGGGPNPHDTLSPDTSAQKIFAHVVEGTRMLRLEGIPEDIIEFCYSHHGSSRLEYFWHKNLARNNPDELTEQHFTYPGHKPTTRETGILMLVDAIEAAARTLDNPDRQAFGSLVQRIIFSKLTQGQLDDSGLTLAELKDVSNVIIDTLVSMYHTRIKYPWQTEDTDKSLSDTSETRRLSEPPGPLRELDSLKLDPKRTPAAGVHPMRMATPVGKDAPGQDDPIVLLPSSSPQSDPLPELDAPATEEPALETSQVVEKTYTGPMPTRPDPESSTVSKKS